LEFTNGVTGEITRGTCQNNSCPFCGPVQVRRRVDAIARSLPQRLITFTRVPTVWGEAQRAVNRAIEKIRGWGFAFDGCWTIEENPKILGKAAAFFATENGHRPS
jgi:hypothetical protein